MWHYSVLIMMLLSVTAFVARSHHLLNALILLEYMVLIVYLALVLKISSGSLDLLVLISLFVISVTAAAVGLSLLVPLARSYGSDYLSSFSVLW